MCRRLGNAVQGFTYVAAPSPQHAVLVLTHYDRSHVTLISAAYNLSRMQAKFRG